MALTGGERREAGQIVDRYDRPVLTAVFPGAAPLAGEHVQAGRAVDGDGRDIVAFRTLDATGEASATSLRARGGTVYFGTGSDTYLQRLNSTTIEINASLWFAPGAGPLLFSPSGDQFRVVVSNAGTLSTVLIP